MAPLDVRKQSTGIAPVLSRRRFLSALAVAGGGAALTSLVAACSLASPAGGPTAAPQPGQAAPSGFANAGTLKILMSSHFVPAYDAWFDQWAKDWGTKNKVEVQADHILSSDLAAKNAAEVSAGSGHDIYKFSRNGEPILYHAQMNDVSDVTKQIGEAHGGWIPFAETLGLSEGVWYAVP